MRYRIGKTPNLRAGRNLRSWGKIQANLAKTGSAGLDQLAEYCADHDHATGGPGFVQYCIKREWLVPVSSTQPTPPPQTTGRQATDISVNITASNGDSGIYIALIRTEEYMPVTRDRRYVETCARINNQNVKIGKAQSFRVRERNYWKDFDQDNVEFIPIARLVDIQGAETAILQRLDAYRLLSPKKGKMDWLTGISPTQVVQTAYTVLDGQGFRYDVIGNRFSSSA